MIFIPDQKLIPYYQLWTPPHNKTRLSYSLRYGPSLQTSQTTAASLMDYYRISKTPGLREKQPD